MPYLGGTSVSNLVGREKAVPYQGEVGFSDLRTNLQEAKKSLIQHITTPMIEFFSSP